MKIRNSRRTLKTKKFLNMYEILNDLYYEGCLIDFEHDSEDEISLLSQICMELMFKDIIDLMRCKNRRCKYRKVKNRNVYNEYENRILTREIDDDDDELLNFLDNVEILTLSILNGWVNIEDLIGY